MNIVARMCGDYIDGVLDWQLNLLDHTQLHTITVYTLYNSQQLTLFSSSEDLGSNSATTAATKSYGVPCHYSLTGHCQSQSYFTTDDHSVSKSWFQGPWGSHDLIFISVDIYEYCFIDYGSPLWRGPRSPHGQAFDRSVASACRTARRWQLGLRGRQAMDSVRVQTED
jgi:hypothetical protein